MKRLESLAIFMFGVAAPVVHAQNLTPEATTSLQSYYPKRGGLVDLQSELVFEGRSCRILYWDRAKNGSSASLDSASCKFTQELVSESKQIPLATPHPDRQTTDTPRFRIRLANETHWRELGLKAPEECSIQPTGALDCKKGRLDSLEKLLVELLSYANRFEKSGHR